MEIQVQDRPEALRYEALVEGRVAGYAAYTTTDTVITFTHAVVEPEFEGQGVGGTLARSALDDARSRGLGVVPRCSFIRGWIDRHADYADLVLGPAAG